MSRNSESLNFIVLKTNNLETKIPEKKIAQNNPRKKRNFFKKLAGYQQYFAWRLILKV